MRSFITTLAILATTASILAAYSANASDPDHRLVILEEDGLMFSELPLQELEAAQSRYLRHEPYRSGVHVRRAAALVQTESRRAHDAVKSGLRKSALELDALAVRFEKGQVKSAQDFNVPFSLAAVMLGRHHALEAKKAQKAKDAKRANHYLRTSSIDLERALLWSGREAETEGRFSLHMIREEAGRAINGRGWNMKMSGEAIDWTDREAEDLGEAITPIEWRDPG